MPGEASRDKLIRLLVASTTGVYLLIAVGVTTALTNAVAACPTWPHCGTHPLAALGDLELAIALGHRATALVVGLVLLSTVWTAWRREVADRIRVCLGVAAVLYPIQIAVGAVTAVAVAPTWLSALHLVVAMVLFSTLLLALLWHLEGHFTVEPSTAESPGLAPTTTDPSPIATPRTWHATLRSTVTAYVALTKPRLWWLLALVAVAAMALAAGSALEPSLVLATVVGGVLAIGASGTFNHVLERDRDRRMARTSNRPLAQDRIRPGRAVTFGVVLAASSVGVFLAFVNVLAAVLGVMAILFYTIVYTLVLKPHTDQNTVLGGAAGVFPALIGWAAVENAVGLPAVALGAVVFLWTPAHFYNLALVYKDDYARAGFPMLPVVRGDAVTRRHITLYLGATMLAAVSLGAVTRLDWVYAAATVTLGIIFLWAVVREHTERTDRAAFRSFMASNAYLGVLLVAVLVDALAV